MIFIKVGFLPSEPFGSTLRHSDYDLDWRSKDVMTDPIMAALFVGHGNPMNAIEDNEFSRLWQEAAKNIPKPKAILCISAHWETRSSQVTAMEAPRTIHDFYGFPGALFEVQYPAPGSPDLARRIVELAGESKWCLTAPGGLTMGPGRFCAGCTPRRIYPWFS